MNKEFIIYSLNEVYENIQSLDEQEVIDSLIGLKISNLINYYISIVKKCDDEDIVIVELLVKILQYIYNNFKLISPISDSDYDELYALHLSISNKDIVGSINASDKTIVNHRYPDLRGTLDKIHFLTEEERGNDNRASLESWLKTCENVLGKPLNMFNPEVILFPKWDGLSVIFECDVDGKVQRALTRGDTEKNEAIDLTPMFGALTFDTIEGWEGSKFAIKTEVVMSDNAFEALCSKDGEYKNRRSAVSSILNTKELNPLKYLKYLTIVPLRAQNWDTKEIIIHPKATEFYPSMTTTISKYKEFRQIFDFLKESVDVLLGLPIDGIVLHFTDINLHNILGRKYAINKYEVAYKFPPEQKKTLLLSVDFSVGIMGAITPVARVEPVKINGNTIKNISLGSVDRFESLQLKPGDEVYVKYDIIPYLVKTEDCKPGVGNYIKAPTTCEYCGEPLIKDPILKCVNNDCPSRMIGKIVNYLDKMRIPNISIGIVTTLFKAGYLRSIEDLYLLVRHKEAICQLDGFGPKSFKKIIDGVNSRTTVFDYELLGSIGIPDIGQRMFKKILNIYYLDDLMEIAYKGDVKSLTNIHGIKEKTANKIIMGLLMNDNLIQFLKEELKVKRNDVRYTVKVCFTKVRDKDFEEFLDKKGIQVLESYNKEVDILIIKDAGATSSKIDKARKDGKEIITLQEAYELFNYNQGV